MQGTVSPFLLYSFYALIAWGLSAVFVAFRALADNRVGTGVMLRVGVLAWMGIPAFFAMNGTLLDFSGRPPYLMRLVLPMLLIVVACCVSPLGRRIARRLPETLLVGVQAFRLPLEIVLYSLASRSILPIELTFAGYNFDILTGLMALPLWILLHFKKASPWMLWVSNILGTVLLLVIVTLAMLSVPEPFGLFNPPNLLVAFHPWVWLPTFLVPIALSSHLLLFRKLMEPTAPPSENI